MQFHLLHAEIGCDTETAYEPAGSINLGDPLRCPECGESYGLKRWLPPYRVRLRRYGSVLGDAVFDGGDLLVSQAFVTAWSKRGLKGLDVLHPVEIVSVRPRSLRKTLQPYYRVDIQPTKPRIDRARSTLISAEPRCLLCGYPRMTDAILTLRIDEASWSGEDLFAPWGVARLIVTQNVVDMAREHGLRNVTTTPIEDYRWDPLRMHDSGS